MTNLQLCLTIGIPSVLVILGWLHQNTRLNDLRGDVRDVRGEVGGLRSEVGDLRGEVGTLRSEVNAVHSEVAVLRISVDKLSDDYRNFYGMEQKLEGRVEELSRRIA